MDAFSVREATDEASQRLAIRLARDDEFDEPKLWPRIRAALRGGADAYVWQDTHPNKRVEHIRFAEAQIYEAGERMEEMEAVEPAVIEGIVGRPLPADAPAPAAGPDAGPAAKSFGCGAKPQACRSSGFARSAGSTWRAWPAKFTAAALGGPSRVFSGVAWLWSRG